MKQHHQDYIAGRHHYGYQFFGGFVFGALLGAYVGYRLFDSGITFVLAAAVAGFIFAFSCGRYGERTWRSMSDWLRRCSELALRRAPTRFGRFHCVVNVNLTLLEHVI